MTDERRRFCPRCGTALVADLPFCPGCGLNTAETVDRPTTAGEAPIAAGAPMTAAGAPASDRAETASVESAGTPIRRAVERASRAPSTILAALIVAAGMVVFGFLIRPQPTAAPSGPGGQGGSGGAPGQTAALIVGLTIQSPTDGQVVATKEVTVIGLAPPGLTITRDVSFGLDQHATADGTGHWAINVSLNNGDNKLMFRIGDDRSTEQEIRVEYKPQG